MYHNVKLDVIGEVDLNWRLVPKNVHFLIRSSAEIDPHLPFSVPPSQPRILGDRARQLDSSKVTTVDNVMAEMHMLVDNVLA